MKDQAQLQRRSSAGLLSPELCQEIDRWIAKYPPEHKRSAVLPALSLAQEGNGGWLSTELIEAVAEYLEIPPIAAHEAATFYTMFELKPVGRHKISVCTNISCMLCGSDEIVAHLEDKLGVKKMTISLPTELVQEVEKVARAEGKTLSAVVREALRATRTQRLKDELRTMQSYWSRKAKGKCVLPEKGS